MFPWNPFPFGIHVPNNTHETERQNRCEIKANKHGSQQGTHYIANIQGKLTYLTLELCEGKTARVSCNHNGCPTPTYRNLAATSGTMGREKPFPWTQGKVMAVYCWAFVCKATVLFCPHVWVLHHCGLILVNCVLEGTWEKFHWD